MEAWKANTDDKGHLNEGLGTWILEYVLAGRERREDGSRTGTGREPNTPMPGRDRPLSHKPAWGRGSYGRHREANSGQRGRPWGWGRRRGRACACAGPGRRAADLLGACLDIVTLERGEALGAGRALLSGCWSPGLSWVCLHAGTCLCVHHCAQLWGQLPDPEEAGGTQDRGQELDDSHRDRVAGERAGTPRCLCHEHPP